MAAGSVEKFQILLQGLVVGWKDKSAVHRRGADIMLGVNFDTRNFMKVFKDSNSEMKKLYGNCLCYEESTAVFHAGLYTTHNIYGKYGKEKRKCKDMKAERHKFVAMISKYTSTLHTTTNDLASGPYSTIGISVFIVYATLHLLLMQEGIAIDQAEMPKEESVFYIGVKQLAEQYSNHLSQTYEQVLADRKSSVSETNLSTLVKDGEHFSIADWVDHLTGYAHREMTSGDSESLNLRLQAVEAVANQKREDYLCRTMAKFTAALLEPQEVISTWKQLIYQPFPPPYFY